MNGLPANGSIRTLTAREMPLLREHLLRLDPESRRDRFNGAADESFVESYAARCLADGTVVIADSPQEFQAHIKSELARWAKVVKDANIKAE